MIGSHPERVCSLACGRWPCRSRCHLRESPVRPADFVPVKDSIGSCGVSRGYTTLRPFEVRTHRLSDESPRLRLLRAVDLGEYSLRMTHRKPGLLRRTGLVGSCSSRHAVAVPSDFFRPVPIKPVIGGLSRLFTVSDGHRESLHENVRWSCLASMTASHPCPAHDDATSFACLRQSATGVGSRLAGRGWRLQRSFRPATLRGD